MEAPGHTHKQCSACIPLEGGRAGLQTVASGLAYLKPGLPGPDVFPRLGAVCHIGDALRIGMQRSTQRPGMERVTHHLHVFIAIRDRSSIYLSDCCNRCTDAFLVAIFWRAATPSRGGEKGGEAIVTQPLGSKQAARRAV